jgi:Mg-chelatase subunit ChlD
LKTILQRTESQESAAVVVMCDISGSMRGNKIDRLKRELLKLWPEIGKARLMAFSDRPEWIDGGPNALPPVGGNTDLAAALMLAAHVWPSEVIVISDGLPQDEGAALEAAQALPGTISVLFIGDEHDRAGADFMRRLALMGGGMFAHKDLAQSIAIEGTLRGMLALPAPIAL